MKDLKWWRPPQDKEKKVPDQEAEFKAALENLRKVVRKWLEESQTPSEN